MDDLLIGDVASRTGLTLRTLRYYEELGLLTPGRDAGGRRIYDAALIDRLYRIRLQRELGTPLAAVAPDDTDRLVLTQRHLAAVDERLAHLARLRERVRAVEERLLGDEAPRDEELLAALSEPTREEAIPTRRLTLLVYRDLEAAQRHLIEVFGFGPGELTRDGSGAVVHGEVFAGDGVIWLHPEMPDVGLASPSTLGGATHCMAVNVDDVETHHRQVRDAGGDIVHPPMDMPYGVREYAARDHEGGYWSFMQPLDEGETHE